MIDSKSRSILLTEVTIQNYRSIWTATVPLAPFTLLIGANGTGKSNFLRALRDVRRGKATQKHFNHLQDPQAFFFKDDKGQEDEGRQGKIPELRSVRVYAIDSQKPGSAESIVLNPEVQEDGSGVVQVLAHGGNVLPASSGKIEEVR